MEWDNEHDVGDQSGDKESDDVGVESGDEQGLGLDKALG
jgi:hypothetical protein